MAKLHVGLVLAGIIGEMAGERGFVVKGNIDRSVKIMISPYVNDNDARDTTILWTDSVLGLVSLRKGTVVVEVETSVAVRDDWEGLLSSHDLHKGECDKEGFTAFMSKSMLRPTR